jgi:hypothetical protein
MVCADAAVFTEDWGHYCKGDQEKRCYKYFHLFAPVSFDRASCGPPEYDCTGDIVSRLSHYCRSAPL